MKKNNPHRSALYVSILLVVAFAAGVSIWMMLRGYERELATLDMPQPEASGVPLVGQSVLYGVQGTLGAKDEGVWEIKISAPSQRAGQTVIVRLSASPELLQTVIKNQLPRSPDGLRDHNEAIAVRPAQERDFQANDTVYVVSRENIDGKKEFEVFRVYRIVYE